MLTDGLAAAMMSTPQNGIRLVGRALLYRLGFSVRSPAYFYLPGHGRLGDLSIGATPDGPFGEKLMTPKDGTPWHYCVAARSLLSFSWRRPVRRAGSLDVYRYCSWSLKPTALRPRPPHAKSPAERRGLNCFEAPAAITTSTRAAPVSPMDRARRSTSFIVMRRPQSR